MYFVGAIEVEPTVASRQPAVQTTNKKNPDARRKFGLCTPGSLQFSALFATHQLIAQHDRRRTVPDQSALK